jgi:hypothetical protein
LTKHHFIVVSLDECHRPRGRGEKLPRLFGPRVVSKEIAKNDEMINAQISEHRHHRIQGVDVAV